MKKILFCFSLALTGLMASCVDKYEEVDADSKPSWLGGSIYAELKNPNQDRLTGTFENYLRLIDDLGYAETLDRTGSKTVFPANDEAFKRFFSSNDWGVTSYEELSLAQKNLLFKTSMLNNALLIRMLPNVYYSTNTDEGMDARAVKHLTDVSVLDTIQHIASRADMPQGTTYWDRFATKGIDIVCDKTTPAMVHLTREYMLNNDITTTGDNSDFAILTGTPYTEGTAYIFNNRVIKSDITCQNGYIHQLEDVLVPPGNMAQVLRRHAKTTLYSRILDHFAAPYYDENTTRQYNDWAMANNVEFKDSIFQMRYMSSWSQGGELYSDPDHPNSGSALYSLQYDPGWNGYYPGSSDASLNDIGAFFVPNDDAVKRYFLPGGSGSHLIEIYGSNREGAVINDEAHLMENLDSLHAKRRQVMASFTKNLMKSNFTTTVPSKFETVTNDASENMGLTLDLIDRKENGKYDITIANNGVVYIINEMIVPDEYRSVMAPASEYPDMKVMDWAIKDSRYLGLDFKYYLMAMSANYALFLPEDAAFGKEGGYYVDPTSFGNAKTGPRALYFYYDYLATREPYLKCEQYEFNLESGEIGASLGAVEISDVTTQLADILNYHTLVLNAGENIGQNHYYKTKHGGTVYVEDSIVGARIMSGSQIDNPRAMPAPRIKGIYHQKNGNAYRMDRVIQPPHQSVYKVLSDNAQFSEFLELCTMFEAEEVLAWAGISSDMKVDAAGNKLGYSEADAYIVFTANYKLGSTSITGACPDYNVKMFNTYNYTLFAPDNEAMSTAYNEGLPRWKDIIDLFNKWPQEEEHEPSEDEKDDMDRAKEMITQIRDFVRYHFVTNSVYADNTVSGGRYQSLCSDKTGVAKEMRIAGGDGKIEITDASNRKVTIDAKGQKLVNKMTRDYWFKSAKASATAIETSSFCAVHQISTPLHGNLSGKFNE